MDRQPVLEGERLCLRPLTPHDWSALYSVASDPLLWEQHPCDDRWQEAVFRLFFDDALAQGGALAVIDKAKGAAIGSSRFQSFDAADGGSVEIGWTFLAPDAWGTGHNAEMKRLMITHALQWVGRVQFRVGEDNYRSRRAMEKIGGRLTQQLEHGDYKGRSILHVYYEITRESFAAGPLSPTRG